MNVGHFRHGCLPIASKGYRCTARQSCAAAPSSLPAQPQSRIRAGDFWLWEPHVVRACGEDKSMFQDATKGEKRACGSSAHAWRSRPFSSPAVSHIPFSMTAHSPAQRARLARPCVGHSLLSTCCESWTLSSRMPAHCPRGFSTLLYNLGTFVTDACPLPQRVSDALPGRAACSLQTLVTFGSQTSAHHAVRARARSAALLRA